MKIKTRINITNPGSQTDEKATLSISISDFEDEQEAKKALKMLQPYLTKLSGQALLTDKE